MSIRIDWKPRGLVENAGVALGVDDHQVKADAKRFKAFIEDTGRPNGVCRGEVRPRTT